jgi:nucleoside phosphorylase
MQTKADILLVTATNVETNAVLQEFRAKANKPERVIQVEDRSYFELASVHDLTVRLVQCQMGSGGVGSSLQTVSKAIEALEPRAIVMVGIAMGVDKNRQDIGDVLISRKLTLYEQRRMGEKEMLRGDRASAPGLLTSRFEAAISVAPADQTFKVRPGLILTGEKLIDEPGFRAEVLAWEPEAVGVEMEGAGLYVASVDAGISWIVVKAICDWGDGKKSYNKIKRQMTAAANAAKFVYHALALAPLLPATRREENATANKIGDEIKPLAEIIDGLWRQRERDIENLFVDVGQHCGSRDELHAHLDSRFAEFISGNVFGATVGLPWDFTLTAVTYDGVLVYHPTINRGVRIDRNDCLVVAIEKRNGTSIWTNSKASEQLRGAMQTGDQFNHRFTKLYFRDYPKLAVVVTYEAHINVIDRLPRMQKPVSQPPTPAASPPLDGVWKWQGSVRVTFNGNCAQSEHGPRATLAWEDRARGILILNWDNGFRDTMQVSSDFKSMKGINNLNQPVVAVRWKA